MIKKLVNFKRVTAMVLAGALAVAGLYAPASPLADSVAEAAEDFVDLDQDEIVAAMGAGWNLGNQLESSNKGVPIEGYWVNNYKVTPAIFKAVKAAGFDSVRIPVSYLNYIESDSDAEYGYSINDDWLDRIQAVVDMALAEDLFVIINMHGDGYVSVSGSWLLCAETNQTPIRLKYRGAWFDIASRFKDYDERLIFESMNEEFDGKYYNISSFSNASTNLKRIYNNIMNYNQDFVDVVRESGSNNTKRWLLVPGWNTTIDYTVDPFFNPPTDENCTADGNRIMISVHYYDPYQFTHDQGSNTSNNSDVWYYESNSNTLINWANGAYMESQFESLYDRFTSQGYPVVIGEYGAEDKSSSTAANTECRENWIKWICTYSKQYGCVPVYWDNGADGSFAIFDRMTAKPTQQNIIDVIMSVYPNDNSTGNEITEESYVWEGSATGHCSDTKSPGSGHTAGKTAPVTESTGFVVSTGYNCGLELQNYYNSVFYSNFSDRVLKESAFAAIVNSMTKPMMVVTTQNGGDAYSWDWTDSITFESGVPVELSAIGTYFCLFGGDDTITKVELYDAVPDLKVGMFYTQKTEVVDGKYAQRWIYVMDKKSAAESNDVVFKIENKTDSTWEGNGTRVREVKYYYDSISAAGTSLTAPEGCVFVCYAIKNIPRTVKLGGSIEFNAESEKE